MPIESDKKELDLSINVFQKPTELAGKEAWAQLMCNLLFTRKGTYPTQPNLGIGIQDYEYEFIDDAIDILRSEIPAQQRTYLPEVPLSSTTVYAVDDPNGQKILVVALTFEDNGATDNMVLAATVTHRLIDWEIVM